MKQINSEAGIFIDLTTSSYIETNISQQKGRKGKENRVAVVVRDWPKGGDMQVKEGGVQKHELWNK